MELILENWWQFSIVAIVLIIGTVMLGKSAETNLVLIKDILITLARESLFRNASSRATTVNVIMLIFLGIAMLALVIPSTLIQIGLKEENSYFVIALGFLGFIVVGGGSGYWISRSDNTFSAFQDDEIKVVDEQSKKKKSRGRTQKM